MSDTSFYDELAGSYDLLISWKRRLRRERPFFMRVFKEFGVRRVLDTACGTGMHAIAFHDWGFHVAGTDISLKMVEKAKENAGHRPIEFVQAGFTELDKTHGIYDAVTCLGNSLPHVLTDDELDRSLFSMFNALLPGGVLIIHNNNYDRILSTKDRFMPLAHGRQGGRDCLFMRFFDFHEDLLTFNVITLEKRSGEWMMHPNASTHRALTHDLLVNRLEMAGFINIRAYGGYPDQPYDKLESDNLIIVAQHPHTPVSRPRGEPVSAIDRIPIRENGEPVVDISKTVPAITVKEGPLFARKTVVEMLAKAQSLLPDGYHLHVRCGCRALEHQRKIYTDFYQNLAAQHPDWPVSQLRREVNKFLAPPDAKHPPGHSTGGAIDLTIIGPDGAELDMTSLLKESQSGLVALRTYNKLITPLAAKNRQLLIDVMSAADFSNYPGEWWHWSYGDSAWAVRVDAPCAVYGASEGCSYNQCG
jgi:D-alanyl-D-alanine dipeptidase